MGGEGSGGPRRPVFGRLVRNSVQVGECLVFQGRPVKDGYAQIRIGPLRPHAHRAMWEECFGLIPEGHEVHHSCHEPRCVNPEHLVALPAEEHWNLHGKRRREHGSLTMYSHGKCRCFYCAQAGREYWKKRSAKHG